MSLPRRPKDRVTARLLLRERIAWPLLDAAELVRERAVTYLRDTPQAVREWRDRRSPVADSLRRARLAWAHSRHRRDVALVAILLLGAVVSALVLTSGSGGEAPDTASDASLVDRPVRLLVRRDGARPPTRTTDRRTPARRRAKKPRRDRARARSRSSRTHARPATGSARRAAPTGYAGSPSPRAGGGRTTSAPPRQVASPPRRPSSGGGGGGDRPNTPPRSPAPDSVPFDSSG